MAHRGRLHVGTSGYQYGHWRGPVYPEDEPKRRWFALYAERFATVEINNTFYRLPDGRAFDAWREAAPRGFRYALKYSRFGTHIKRLADPAGHVGMFVERARRLRSALGPILVQLPPRWRVDVERLEAFLAALPPRMRWALELRDKSWLCEEVYASLRRHRVALCIHDLLPNHPRELTARWTYLRFHGPTPGRKYAGSYSGQRLAAAARRIRGWLAAGRDVYAYFNNDERGHAVFNAEALLRYAAARP